MTFEGDNKLSAKDRHLWSLCYSTLCRFGCPTIFKVTGPDVRYRLDCHIRFYVPGSHPLAAEVVDYLETELRPEIMASETVDGEYRYGTSVSVDLFTGLDWYLDRNQLEPMIENAVAEFNRMLEDRQRKPQ